MYPALITKQGQSCITYYIKVGRGGLCPADLVVKSLAGIRNRACYPSLTDGELRCREMLCRSWSQPPKLVFCAPNGLLSAGASLKIHVSETELAGLFG